jgi:hypothetical protein
MIVSFAGQTVTRIRADLIEDPDGSNYGNPMWDWDHAERVDIEDVSVQPVARPELIGPAADAVPTRWLIVDSANGNFLATDRVEYNGVEYEVDGDPAEYETGVLDHAELFIQRVAG